MLFFSFLKMQCQEDKRGAKDGQTENVRHVIMVYSSKTYTVLFCVAFRCPAFASRKIDNETDSEVQRNKSFMQNENCDTTCTCSATVTDGRESCNTQRKILIYA